MTSYAEIWRLPGPGAYVREVAEFVSRGQHVLAVVPEYIAHDAEYSNALSVAIAAELENSKRLFPSSAQGPLAAAIGFEASYDFDDFPSTVAELIGHRDVVGRAFICNLADLEPRHSEELPAFLSRLEQESRSVARADRGTMAFVMGHRQLPDDAQSVGMARVWYWDRVARWDVAALLARTTTADAGTGALAEVRVETIIELARWDFALAEEISRFWTDGDTDVADFLATKSTGIMPSVDTRRIASRQPPEGARGAWDVGIFDSWHGEPGFLPAVQSRQEGQHDRLIWSAQARVMMPWIEIRRFRIERIVRAKLGDQRMDAAIQEYSTRFPGVDDDSSSVEIATLARIISARLGSNEPRLRSTARALRDARNRLAHLTPLPQLALAQLVADCAWLRG